MSCLFSIPGWRDQRRPLLPPLLSLPELREDPPEPDEERDEPLLLLLDGELLRLPLASEPLLRVGCDERLSEGRAVELSRRLPEPLPELLLFSRAGCDGRAAG